MKSEFERPVEVVLFGEFTSPERDWRHLTRNLLEYELFLVTEGVLCIGDERRDHVVPAGEYLLMAPTRYQHGTEVCRCRFYWLHFRCPLGEPPVPERGRIPDMRGTEDLARSLFRAERQEPCGLFSRYLATSLLLSLKGTGLPAAASPHAVLTEQIKDYVFRRRCSDVRVEEIAEHFGYHVKYLSAVFRKEANVTLKRFIMESRLREAERLLLETDYSASEIAYSLNFPSPHAFFRFFKKIEKKTPGKFRMTNKTAIPCP